MATHFVFTSFQLSFTCGAWGHCHSCLSLLPTLGILTQVYWTFIHSPGSTALSGNRTPGTPSARHSRLIRLNRSSLRSCQRPLQKNVVVQSHPCMSPFFSTFKIGVDKHGGFFIIGPRWLVGERAWGCGGAGREGAGRFCEGKRENRDKW